MKRKPFQVVLFLFALAVVALMLWAALPRTHAPAHVRPADWAQPIERAGLPNLHKVSDDLYRGAQPTEEGMRQLEAMGIRTVVSLREFHSDRGKIGGTRLAYERIRVEPWALDDKDVVRFLRLVAEPRRRPVFVHCQYGADRTGAMCAAYRIVVQGWSREDAVREMTEGNFGFHENWQNLICYLRALNVEKVKKQIASDAFEPATQGG